MYTKCETFLRVLMHPHNALSHMHELRSILVIQDLKYRIIFSIHTHKCIQYLDVSLTYLNHWQYYNILSALSSRYRELINTHSQDIMQSDATQG